MSTHDMAAALARGIFACGDEPNDKAQRIQFMGGSWPDSETNLGGLSEVALASLLVRLIETHKTEGK